MAISFSRPDPSSPAAVGAAQFTVGRRGFEQEEVRDFLRMVSAEMARLQERERFLESELRALQTQGISSPGVLDEETVMRVLGEETARVLTAAREAANQMRSRATESADRIVREATADAARMRNDAEVEVSRQRADAIEDSEAEIELAKQQGREMVEEARAYREKVLSELSRRRELAREQIEHLIHHRDRLATAFERARLAAADVVGDLDEFDELAEEVERSAGLSGGALAPVFVDHTADPDAIPQRTLPTSDEVDGQRVDTSLGGEAEEEVTEDLSVVVEEISEEHVETERIEPSESRQSAVMAEHPSTEQPSEHMAVVVQLFGAKNEDNPLSQEVARDPANSVEDSLQQEIVKTKAIRGKEKKSVDELFAKLREAKIEDVARALKSPIPKLGTEAESGSSKAVIPPTNPALFKQRDATLEPIINSMMKSAKRVLADLENGALTALQGKKFTVSLETLIPPTDSMVQELMNAIATDVTNAALAGAQSVTSGLKADLRKRVTQKMIIDVVSPQVMEMVVTPLRMQLQDSIEQCNADKLEMPGLTRSAFREMKLQRIDMVVADLACLAYSKGAYLALAPGTKVYWMVDPNGPNCADAEDNSLAGACALGDQFPTGHLHPTCHQGCRCLLGPAT